MLVRDATRKDPVTIGPDTPLHEAARLMDSEVVGALVVLDGDRITGIVTDRDLVVRGLANREPDDARVDSVMTTDPRVVAADADVRDAVALFRAHAVRRMPVVDGDRLVGLLAVDDLLIDLVADLGDVVRPITGEVVFGYPEAALRPPART
jgi:CBS domain-containing protein